MRSNKEQLVETIENLKWIRNSVEGISVKNFTIAIRELEIALKLYKCNCKEVEDIMFMIRNDIE